MGARIPEPLPARAAAAGHHTRWLCRGVRRARRSCCSRVAQPIAGQHASPARASRPGESCSCRRCGGATLGAAPAHPHPPHTPTPSQPAGTLQQPVQVQARCRSWAARARLCPAAPPACPRAHLALRLPRPRSFPLASPPHRVHRHSHPHTHHTQCACAPPLHLHLRRHPITHPPARAARLLAPWLARCNGCGSRLRAARGARQR